MNLLIKSGEKKCNPPSNSSLFGSAQHVLLLLEQAPLDYLRGHLCFLEKQAVLASERLKKKGCNVKTPTAQITGESPKWRGKGFLIHLTFKCYFDIFRIRIKV